MDKWQPPTATGPPTPGHGAGARAGERSCTHRVLPAGPRRERSARRCLPVMREVRVREHREGDGTEALKKRIRFSFLQGLATMGLFVCLHVLALVVFLYVVRLDRDLVCLPAQQYMVTLELDVVALFSLALHRTEEGLGEQWSRAAPSTHTHPNSRKAERERERE